MDKWCDDAPSHNIWSGVAFYHLFVRLLLTRQSYPQNTEYSGRRKYVETWSGFPLQFYNQVYAGLQARCFLDLYNILFILCLVLTLCWFNDKSLFVW
jgi:hypothetical protein